MNSGIRMYNFAKKIFPYHRSITGIGVRKTLAAIDEYIKKDNGPQLRLCEIETGTQVFDWTVPKEWIIREAYIEDDNGNKIVDIKENNLSVLGYSIPVDRWVDLTNLKKYLYTQVDQPDVIPYVTSYYKEQYGFCISENKKNALPPGNYHMFIDSELKNGVLNYADTIIPGETNKEVFFSTYICHPSMANNECSGPALAAELIRYIHSIKYRKYSYRFIFIPETIGSLTYLSIDNHLEYLKEKMIAGFNLSCVGDNRNFSMVSTRNGHTLSDKVLENVLSSETNNKFLKYSYLSRGSDERQYNAPGIDLPVVCFCRSKYSEYPEYHTSADNMDLVSPAGFQGSYNIMTKVIDVIEHNDYYKCTVLGEPQLGKRGLYPNTSQKGSYDSIKALVNFIAYADGKNDIIDISNIIGIPAHNLIPIIEILKRNRLINNN